MAEWFKATDLRPVIYDAWVRTPLAAKIEIEIEIESQRDSCKRLKEGILTATQQNCMNSSYGY